MNGLSLTRRGERLLVAICVLITAIALGAAWLAGQDRQTRWCDGHPTQASVVAACQTGALR